MVEIMTEKPKITKVIENKGYKGKDKIEFEPVKDVKKGTLYFKLKQLQEEKGIELKKGVEIELKNDSTGYKLICKNQVIGRAHKYKKDEISQLDKKKMI